MNKPISTWTQTFYKLGYTLRRVWRDEPDYTDNYTPLAIEVLEDRQMLSGFGGDDPMSGGGTGGTGGGSGQYGGPTGGTGGGSNTGGGTGGGGDIIGGGSDSGPGGGLNGPGSGDHTGYSDLVYLTISDHWYSGIPNNNYAWNNPGTILGYNEQHAVGTTTGTFRTADITTADADLGLYFVTLATYQWTITITGSSASGPGSTGGSGAAAWYREHLSVTVSGDIIETTNLQIAEDFKATGSIAGYSGAYSIAGHIVTASTETDGSVATYTYNVTKGSLGNRDKIEVDLHENLETTINHTTSLDSLLDRTGYTDMDLTVSGTVQVDATSKYTRTTDYESNKTSTGGRNFQLSGSEESDIDYTITFINASLIKQTTGYTPVELSADLAGQRRPAFDSSGQEIPRPSEGLRFAWEMNGTKSSTTKLTHEYSGNGTFAYLSDTWIRVGEITSQYDEVSNYNNNYTSTVQRDETMLDVTKIFWVDNFGDEGYSYIKLASPDPPYQYVVLHSRSETVDKSNGETKTMYALKRAYLDDGKVRTTTESVVDEGTVKPSFVHEVHNPDLKTDITSAELAVSQSFDHDQTDFNYTTEELHLSGNWNRTAVYNTTNETSQIADSPTVFTGTVSKTGSKNITIEYDAESIDSRTGWKYEFVAGGVQAVAIEVGSNTGTSTSPVGDSTLTNILASTFGSTETESAIYDFHYAYGPDEEVVVQDNSVITSYTTRLSSEDVENEFTERNTYENGTTIHYKSESNSSTTVTGKAIHDDDTVQPAWNQPGLQSVKIAMVGEAFHIVRNTTTTYTPIPGSENEADVTANSVGSSPTGRTYEVDLTGTETVLDLSKIETISNTDGSKLTDTTKEGVGQDEVTPYKTLEFLNSTWDNSTTVEVFNSTTDTITSYEGTESYSIHSTGTNQTKTIGDGHSKTLSYKVIQSGDPSLLLASAGISPFDPSNKSMESTFEMTDLGRNAILNASPDDFPSDFLLDVSRDFRNTTEETSEVVRRDSDFTAFFERKLVQDDSQANDGSDGQASQTIDGDDSTNEMVWRFVEMSRTGNVTNTIVSSNESWDDGFDVKYRFSRVSSGTFAADNLPGTGHIEFAYSFARNDLASDRQNITTTFVAKRTSTDYGTLTNGVYVDDGVVTLRQEVVPVDGMGGAGIKTYSNKLQTRRNELIVKKWEDNLGGGSGQFTFSHLSSEPIEGPNYHQMESTSVSFSDFLIRKTPVPSEDGNSNNDGGSDQGGSSTPPGNTGTSSQSSRPSVEAQFDNVRDTLARKSAPAPGVDVFGTIVTTSNSAYKFAEQWTKDIANVYGYFSGSEHHIGASIESSQAKRTVINNKEHDEAVVFLTGAAYTLEELNDRSETLIEWNDHVLNRHTHAQIYPTQVTPPTNVPSLPQVSQGAAVPSGLLPPQNSSPIREYVSHTYYNSPSNKIEGETSSEILEPFTYDPDSGDKFLYLHTRTLEVDAQADAMVHTKEISAITTHTKTEFSESNIGETSEVRQMHQGPQGGFVEDVQFDNNGTAPTIAQYITVLRRQADNYVVTSDGSVPLVPSAIYVYSDDDPDFFSLIDPSDKKVLLAVKEFAKIELSNETGHAPDAGPGDSYPSDETSEGSSVDGQELFRSITKLILIHPTLENSGAFQLGFLSGFFYDGLVGTLSLGWDLLVTDFEFLEFGATYLAYGHDAAFETSYAKGWMEFHENTEEAYYASLEFGQIFIAVHNDVPKLLGLAEGELSRETQQVIEQVNIILKELLPELILALGEIPEHEKARMIGQVAGIITFEVAISAVVAALTSPAGGAGAALTGAATAVKLCKWARKLSQFLPEDAAKLVLKFLKKFLGCFEAETQVASYSVASDLTTVTLAASVELPLLRREKSLLSNNEWAAIGVGVVVVLTSCGLHRKAKSDQEPDDDPWKVQYHYVA